MKIKEALKIIGIISATGLVLEGCNRMNWTDGAPEYHPITRAVIIKPEDKEAEQ